MAQLPNTTHAVCSSSGQLMELQPVMHSGMPQPASNNAVTSVSYLTPAGQTLHALSGSQINPANEALIQNIYVSTAPAPPPIQQYQPVYQAQAAPQAQTVTYHQMQTPQQQQQQQQQQQITPQAPHHHHHQHPPQPPQHHMHPAPANAVYMNHPNTHLSPHPNGPPPATNAVAQPQPQYTNEPQTQATYLQLQPQTRVIRTPGPSYPTHYRPASPMPGQPALNANHPSPNGPRVSFKGNSQRIQRMFHTQAQPGVAPQAPRAVTTLNARAKTKVVMLQTNPDGSLRPVHSLRGANFQTVRAINVQGGQPRTLNLARLRMPEPVQRPNMRAPIHASNQPIAEPQPQVWGNQPTQPHTMPSQPPPRPSHYQVPPNPQVQTQHQVQHQAQQQQPRVGPIHQAPPQNESEIAYNVEHIFIEEGREVSKMPIKVGDSTFWVDCVNEQPQEASANSISFELDPSMPVISQPNQVTSQPNEYNQNGPPQSTMATPAKKTKINSKDIPQEERDRAIKRVTEEHISPGIVGEDIGVTASAVRSWIKGAGLTLPAKYKQVQKKTQPVKETPQPLPAEIPQQTAPPQPQPAPLTASTQPNNMPYNNPTHPANANLNQLYAQPQPHPVGPPGFQASNVNNFRPQMQQNHRGPRPPPQGVIRLPMGSPQKSPLTLIPARSDSPTVKDGKVSADGLKPGEKYTPRYVAGKLKLCRNCGSTSADFNRCEACRKPLPDDCKIVTDHNQKRDSSMGDDGNSTMSPRDSMGGTELGEGGKLELRGVRINHNKRKKKAPDEPVCIALSSDEEDEADEQNGQEGGQEGNQSGETQPSDKSDSSGVQGVTDEEIGVNSNSFSPAQGNWVSLHCRSIRIGSYKAAPKDKACFGVKGFQIRVPGFTANEIVKLNFRIGEVLEVKVHFGKNMPAMFFFVTPAACERTRKILGMYDPTGFWLDSQSKDDTMKRITILPERLRDEDKTLFSCLFKEKLYELDSKTTNELLVKCSPRDINMVKAKMAANRALMGNNTATGSPASSGGPDARKTNAAGGAGEPEAIMKYCQFPLTGANSVSVGTEDYICLEEDNFLNDVIIDFFFRWLQFEKLEPVDRERTHMFSTFFYKRLTTRPKKMKNRVHPVEDNPNLSAADKRYERVKRWTKKVDIFNKDFVFVPINEQSHWFLAVICFPGLIGCRSMEDDSPIDMPESQKLVINASKPKVPRKDEKKILQIGSTSIIPLKGSAGEKFVLNTEDDASDRDEAEASDDDMMDEEDELLTRMGKITSGPPTARPVIQLKAKEASPDPADSESKEKPEQEKKGIKDEKTKAEESELDEDDDLKDGALKLEESDPESETPANEKEQENVQNKPAAEKSPLPSNAEDKRNPTEKAAVKDEKPCDTKTDPKAESRPSIKQPCILIFDSLNTGSRARVAATLRDYLTCEYKDKKGEPRLFTRENMKGNCPKVPQQPNFSDCGIFVLQYAQSFFENPIRDFSLPITSLRNWFSTDIVRAKRGEIGEIIRSLAKEQNPKKTIRFPEISFNPGGYSDDEGENMSDEDEKAKKKSSPTTLISQGKGKMVTVSASSGNLIRLPIMKKEIKPTTMSPKVTTSGSGMLITKKAGNVTLTRLENGTPLKVSTCLNSSIASNRELKPAVVDSKVPNNSARTILKDMSDAPELKKARIESSSENPPVKANDRPSDNGTSASVPTSNGCQAEAVKTDPAPVVSSGSNPSGQSDEPMDTSGDKPSQVSSTVEMTASGNAAN